MSVVVITGSARGFGFEMAKEFRRNNYDVVISDLKVESLEEAKKEIEKEEGSGKVEICTCDISKYNDLEKLAKFAVDKFEKIDIWINNAGVNQPMEALWELSEEHINRLIDIDLKGTVHGSLIAMREMSKKHSGAIYNVEGYGSNDAHMLGLNMYGTTKRALTHFTDSLALESSERNTGVIVGKLSPGIMITKFTTHSMGEDKINLPEKTKKVYNILGDTPDVIAKFMVNRMINNTKNKVRISWLTNGKAFVRFMTAGFNKRNFFEDE